MKLIVKQKGKLCEAFMGRPEYSTLKASDFLKLTTTPALYADIKKRIAKGYLSDFDMAKAGQLQLSINKDGRVTSHEGRHRCMAAIAKHGPDVLMKVNTYIEGGGSLEQFPEIQGQYDPSVMADLSDFDYDNGPLSWEDVLDLGDWGEDFSTAEEFEKWCNSRHNAFNEKYEITKEKFVQFINYYYQFSSVDGERARVELEDDKIIMPFQVREPFYVKRLRPEKK